MQELDALGPSRRAGGIEHALAHDGVFDVIAGLGIQCRLIGIEAVDISADGETEIDAR